DVVASFLDFTCVHPYPIYQPHLYPDSLLAPRMTHAAAFETALAFGAGSPVMVHEYGASSAQFQPEAIAAYDRLLSWSSLGRGAMGYSAGCWTDGEPAAYARAPYVRQPHEPQSGVTDWQGTPRPRGHVLAELARTARLLPLQEAAFEGPAPAAAVIVVPHEFVRPFDRAAFGLGGRPRPYPPAQRGRRTDRHPPPLAPAALAGVLLAPRARPSLPPSRER